MRQIDEKLIIFVPLGVIVLENQQALSHDRFIVCLFTIELALIVLHYSSGFVGNEKLKS